MKKWKLSNRFQDYFWGIMCLLSGMLLIWISGFFVG